MKPKPELIRVVRAPEGGLSLDFRGKKPGRGAYLCPDPACLTRAKKAAPLSAPCPPPRPPRCGTRWRRR